MKLWLIDKSIDINNIDIQEADLIINFTCQTIKHQGIISLPDEYAHMRENIRKKYIEYVGWLGSLEVAGKSIKQHFVILGVSLWWFGGIAHKDSFNDSLFDDICKILLIKKISKEKQIDKIVVLSDSTLLRYIYWDKAPDLMSFAISKLKERIKLLIRNIIIKVKLIFSRRFTFREADSLFFVYYPEGWNEDMRGEYSNRIFRNLPNLVDGAGYLMNLLRMDGKINRINVPILPLQKYLSFLDVFRLFFDFSNLFKYCRLRIKLSKSFIFEDIDLSPVYEKYLREMVLFNDFNYALLIKGTEKACKRCKPKSLITSGEFGPHAKAIIAGVRKLKITTIWLQHAVVSKWKLWYFNSPTHEIDSGNPFNKDYIRFLPMSDYFIAWSEDIRCLLQGFGYPEDRIIILGNPRYDGYRDMKTSLSGSTFIDVVLAPTVDKDEMQAFALLAKEVRRKNSNYNIVLKLHPRHKDCYDKEIADLLNGLKDDGVKIDTSVIEKYYKPTTILFSGVSTVGIEAAYFGAKVIIYIAKHHNRFTPNWLQEGIYAHSPEEAVAMIDEIEDIPMLNWRKFYLEPGKSEDSVREFIERMAK